MFVEGRSGKHYSTPGRIQRKATQAFIQLEVLRKGGTDALGGTLTGLALAYDQTIGSILVDNISVATTLDSQTWTCAADNGNNTVAAGAFTAEQLTFLAQPFSFDELTYVDDLIASATVEEWSAISDGS